MNALGESTKEVVENPSDQKVVEDFLLNLTGTSKYIKSLNSENKKYFAIKLEDTLSKKQVEILLGDQYLNIPEDVKYPANVHPSTIPGLEVSAPEEHSHILEVFRAGEREPINSEEPFIRKIREDIEKIQQSYKRNVEEITNKGAEFRYCLEMKDMGSSRFKELQSYDSEALHLLANIILWNAFIRTGEISDQVLEDTLFRIRELQQEEERGRREDIRFIGCEVEVPYTGSLTSDRIKAAHFVSSPGALELLNQLGVPTEEDKQGEVALPKSRSELIQYNLLHELGKAGFAPQGSELGYTLQINVSLSNEEYLVFHSNGFLDSRLSEDQDPILSNRVDIIGMVLGKRFSSAKRLLTGAYGEPVLIKENFHTPDTKRLEVRPLSYDPNQTQEEFGYLINSTRKFVDNVLTNYLQSGVPINDYRYGTFIKNYAKIVTGQSYNGVEESEKLLVESTDSLFRENNFDDKLRKLFDDFIQDIK